MVLIVIGFVAGCITTSVMYRLFTVGALRVDMSDPDGPFMFLELSKDMKSVISKKYVVMKVKLKNYICEKEGQ